MTRRFLVEVKSFSVGMTRSFIVEVKGLPCRNDNTLPVILKELFATEESIFLGMTKKFLVEAKRSFSVGMTNRFLVEAKGASLSE
jgi:hypothetical protein